MVLFVVGENLLSVEPSSGFTRLLILVGVGLGLNGIYAGLLWAKFFPPWLAVIAAMLDAVLAIGLMIMLTKHAQLLLPLMVVPVMLAGLRWNAEGGLLMALPIALSYGIPLVPLLGENIDRL